jgi:RsiW-degrading membrane proteinase PrsW (M82 family)
MTDGYRLKFDSHGGHAGQDYSLDGAVLRAGREPDCDLRLDEPGVSRHHAEFRRQADGSWTIADLQSTNGTLVNGVRIGAEAVPLHAGDSIQLGSGGPLLHVERRSVTPGPALADAAAAHEATPAIHLPHVPHIPNIPKLPNIPMPRVPHIAAGAGAAGAAGPPRPGGALGPRDEEPHLSEVLPFVSQRRLRAMKPGLLAPGIVTVVVAVLLFMLMGGQQSELYAAFSNGIDAATQQAHMNDSLTLGKAFDDVLGTYLIAVVVYLVFRVAGRSKSPYAIGGAALLTIVVIVSPIFYLLTVLFDLPAGGDPNLDQFTIFLPVQATIAIGLKEELVKILPVLAGLWFAARGKAPWNTRLGVFDPIDGILIGTASAAAFTFIETLFQYVPGAYTDTMKAFTSQLTGAGFGQLFALELLVPRIIGQVAGHVAWSGYFGYALGLGLAQGRRRWRLVLSAWAVVAIAHGMWDGFSSVQPPLLASLIQLVVGGGSFMLLLAAISRARRVTGMSVPAGAPA